MITMKHGLAVSVMALCIMMTMMTVGGVLTVAQRLRLKFVRCIFEKRGGENCPAFCVYRELPRFLERELHFEGRGDTIYPAANLPKLG